MATTVSSAATADLLIERVRDLPATRRPVTVFLDVDGVINAYSRKHGEVHPNDDWTYSRRFAVSAGTGVQYKMFFAPDMIRVLNALIDGGHIQPFWLTTWWETANSKLVEKFGIHGPFPTLEDDRTDASFFGWKQTHVADMLRQDPSMPAIWIDDDLRTYPERQGQFSSPQRLLRIAPEPHFGISARDLDRVIAFCDDHVV